MGINIKKYNKKTMKSKKEFVRHITKQSELILNNFEKPIKVGKFKKTEYVYYRCKFINLDEEKIMPGNHIVMMPNKSLWLQLYEILEQKDMLSKKYIKLKIIKKNNYVYNIDIDTEYRIPNME